MNARHTGELTDKLPQTGNARPVGELTEELPQVDNGLLELADDPFADDLAELLAHKAPKKYANRATVVLAALALVVAGFIGGSLAQKQWGSVGGNSANPFAGGGNNGSGFGGAPGPVNGSSRAGQVSGGQTSSGQGTGTSTVTGTVKLVDGTTLYIQTADGQTLTVKTSASTPVQESTRVALADLAAGSSVIVVGARAADGTVTASAVTRTK